MPRAARIGSSRTMQAGVVSPYPFEAAGFRKRRGKERRRRLRYAALPASVTLRPFSRSRSSAPAPCPRIRAGPRFRSRGSACRRGRRCARVAACLQYTSVRSQRLHDRHLRVQHSVADWAAGLRASGRTPSVTGWPTSGNRRARCAACTGRRLSPSSKSNCSPSRTAGPRRSSSAACRRSRDEAVRGALIHFVGGCALVDEAVLHHDDAVAQRLASSWSCVTLHGRRRTCRCKPLQLGPHPDRSCLRPGSRSGSSNKRPSAAGHDRTSTRRGRSAPSRLTGPAAARLSSSWMPRMLAPPARGVDLLAFGRALFPVGVRDEESPEAD